MDSPVRLSNHLVLGIAIAAGAAVSALRVLAMAGFSDDHFFYMTRGAQLLHGGWPVRDFVDPGFPLVILLTAAAQVIGGHTLLAEAVLVALGFGLAAALTVWIVVRWTGSVWLGLWAAAMQLVVLPRSYSYPKVLVYVIAMVALLHYVRKPSGRAIVWLAAATVLASLFRHDYGVYVSISAAILVAGHGVEERGLIAAVRRVASYAAATLLFAAPYLVYVQLNEGITPYFREALAYSVRDARRTGIGMPVLGSLGLSSPEGLSVLGYYLFWLTPATALIAAALARTQPRGMRWMISAFAAATLAMNPGFLRDPLTARVPDAVAPFSLLAVWLASRSPRIVAIPILLIALIAGMRIGHFTEALDRAEMLHNPPRPLLRWREVSAQLREPYAERQMPSDTAFALVPFYEYAKACTGPKARVLVLGYSPEIAYYADRGFAGGYPSLYAGYFSSAAEQQRTVNRMQQESVAFVVAAPDGMRELASFPIVRTYVAEHFVPLADINVEGQSQPARILVNKNAAPCSTRQLRSSSSDP